MFQQCQRRFACIVTWLQAQRDGAALTIVAVLLSQKAGLVPTGILANVSRAAGYGNVSQLLAKVCRARCHWYLYANMRFMVTHSAPRKNRQPTSTARASTAR
jgi:hypothetical protein